MVINLYDYNTFQVKTLSRAASYTNWNGISTMVKEHHDQEYENVKTVPYFL